MSYFGTGYIPLRRGIMEHVFDGRLSPTEHHALVSMLALGNAATGVWIGSAPALTTILRYGSKNTMAEALDALEAKGYILRDYAPGRRGNFPIVIDKFELTRGANSGKRVNLSATRRRYGIPEGRLGKLTRKSLFGAISAACKQPVLVSETDRGVDAGVDGGSERGVRSSQVSRSESREEREGGGSEAPARTPGSEFTVEQETPESLFPPESESERSAPVHPQGQTSVSPVLPVPSSTATAFSAEPTPQMSVPEQLATQFFGYQGRPRKFDTSAILELWASTFARLLDQYGYDDLLGAMQWAFEVDSFWPQRLIRATDPLAYFEQKLAEQIMPRYLGWKVAEVNKSKTHKKERNHDQQTRPSATRTGKQPVDNSAAAEQAKRNLAANLFGGKR